MMEEMVWLVPEVQMFSRSLAGFVLLMTTLSTTTAKAGCGSSKMGAKENSTGIQGNHNRAKIANITTIHIHCASPRAIEATLRHIRRIRRSSGSTASTTSIVHLGSTEWKDTLKKRKSRSESSSSTKSSHRTPRTSGGSSSTCSSDFPDVDTFELPLPGTPDKP